MMIFATPTTPPYQATNMPKPEILAAFFHANFSRSKLPDQIR
jgi:hypothetical protein